MTESQATILVIEDEEPIRKLLRVSLTSQGYRMAEAINGKDGVLQAATAQPDLIILDVGLPDMDGVDLTRQIREWSKVPIIIDSARRKEQDKVVALDAGADDILPSPPASANYWPACAWHFAMGRPRTTRGKRSFKMVTSA